MTDLTIIFLTCNDLPPSWAAFQMTHLLKAIGDRPVISVSREPMALGTNLIQTEEKSGWNVYRQMLRAARMAETEFVAVTEDDTLYSDRHFSDFRPPADAVAYNRARWSVFSWDRRPVFGMIRRRGNFAMIGPTALVVEALSERMEKHPNGSEVHGEIGRMEKRLGVTPRKAVEFWSKVPIVNLCHDRGLSPTYLGRPGMKRIRGEMKAWDIPYWGKAKNIVRHFNAG